MITATALLLGGQVYAQDATATDKKPSLLQRMSDMQRAMSDRLKRSFSPERSSEKSLSQTHSSHQCNPQCRSCGHQPDVYSQPSGTSVHPTQYSSQQLRSPNNGARAPVRVDPAYHSRPIAANEQSTRQRVPQVSRPERLGDYLSASRAQYVDRQPLQPMQPIGEAIDTEQARQPIEIEDDLPRPFRRHPAASSVPSEPSMIGVHLGRPSIPASEYALQLKSENTLLKEARSALLTQVSQLREEKTATANLLSDANVAMTEAREELSRLQRANAQLIADLNRLKALHTREKLETGRLLKEIEQNLDDALVHEIATKSYDSSK